MNNCIIMALLVASSAAIRLHDEASDLAKLSDPPSKHATITFSDGTSETDKNQKETEFQRVFSPNGDPLHGIVGWDDVNMKSSMANVVGYYEKSDLASADEFESCAVAKYADKDGRLDRAAALGAV